MFRISDHVSIYLDLLASVCNSDLSSDEMNCCFVHTGQRTALKIRQSKILAQYFLVNFHNRSIDS